MYAKVPNGVKSPFQETSVTEARSLTDGVRLPSLVEMQQQNLKITKNQPALQPVVMPWVGFGTYRLGKEQAQQAILQAVQFGYRAIDTAFIYGGESTERKVGDALQEAIEKGILKSRQDVFITTKHWRKYHGYEPSLECLRLSLSRLKMNYVDLWLMHWPGPAYSTMARRKDVVTNDPWHYATTSQSEMTTVRAETWRAMEDAYRQGLVRAIGVSNMSVEQLKTLKQTATLWPPAVNQVELHPLYPQSELSEYCKKEGIILEAYASLGGQDAGKTVWSKLLGVKVGRKTRINLMLSEPVVELANELQTTPAQTLLRWGLERGCVVIPKTTSIDRLAENAGVLDVKMSSEQADRLEATLHSIVKESNPGEKVEELTRLCWRSDPLRHLDFD